MPEWDTMPKEELRKMQDNKIGTFISTQLFPYSAYYNKLFKTHKIDPNSIKTANDLAKIPFTTKADLLGSPDRPEELILKPPADLFSQPKKKSKFKSLFSRRGGSTDSGISERDYSPLMVIYNDGKSSAKVPFWYSQGDIDQMKECGKRLFKVLGMSYDEVAINGFPYGPNVQFWQTFYLLNRTGLMALQSGGVNVLGEEKILNALEGMESNVLFINASCGYQLLREGVRDKRDLQNIEHIVLGCESVPGGLRDKYRALLKKMGAKDPKILTIYGFTEGKVAWGECAEHSGFHTYPDLEYIEIINPKTGERVGEGEPGEIVYTSLGWHGSCLLRYRTGDIAEKGISYEKCSHCGRTVPRISSAIRRQSDSQKFTVTTAKGKVAKIIDLNEFHLMLSSDNGIEEWQLEVRKNDGGKGVDEFHLSIAPARGTVFKKVKVTTKSKIRKQIGVELTSIKKCKLDDLLERLEIERHLRPLRIVDKR